MLPLTPVTHGPFSGPGSGASLLFLLAGLAPGLVHVFTRKVLILLHLLEILEAGQEPPEGGVRAKSMLRVDGWVRRLDGINQPQGKRGMVGLDDALQPLLESPKVVDQIGSGVVRGPVEVTDLLQVNSRVRSTSSRDMAGATRADI